MITLTSINNLTYEEFESELEDQSFSDLYNYAEEIGYAFLNTTLELFISDQTSVVLSIMASLEDENDVLLLYKVKHPSLENIF